MALIEQTEIAKKLGISMNSLHHILKSSHLENEEYFQLINNKRHYDFDIIIKAIKKQASKEIYA